MARKSPSAKKTNAAVKRGHGGGATKAVTNSSGNRATYPSSQGNNPSGSLLNASGPNPAKWGGSGRAH